MLASELGQMDDLREDGGMVPPHRLSGFRSRRRASGRALRLALLLMVAGCSVPSLVPVTPVPSSTPTHGVPPSPTLVPTQPPPPTVTPLPPDTGWSVLPAGMEVRSLDVAAGQTVERVTVVRMDPALVRLEVFYTPRVAYPVSGWARQLGALLVVNGGYFTPEQMVTGLTIVNGVPYGTALGDYAGMLAVRADGAVSVRWLRTWPYDPTEPLQSTIQSFPVLVKPGGVIGFPADGDDGRVARRLVVAQDRQGRLLFLIAPRGYLSLHALAVWLAGSDLDIDVALNLDGGTSSGFWLADGPQIDSLIPVPVAVGIFER